MRPHVDEPALPHTTILQHAPGWTLFENVYMSNGTLFIVLPPTHTNRTDLPPIRKMISRRMRVGDRYIDREPDERTMQYVTLDAARSRWTRGTWSVEGTTWLFNDPPKILLSHYFHACAEIVLGAWAFYIGKYDPTLRKKRVEHADVPPVQRIVFSDNSAGDWRDRTRFTSFFLYAAFPSASIEGREDWTDRAWMTRHGASSWRFERLLLQDRQAGKRGREPCIAAEAYAAVSPSLSSLWWEPVRQSVLRVAGAQPAEAEKDKVVVTYVSRQLGIKRKLRTEDHLALVASLKELCSRRGWEFSFFDAARYEQEEQMHAAARTTVMVGVHGNGLTHLLHMPPGPQSTVIEIFYPGGWTSDYEFPARARGLKHFSVWNDTAFTFPHPKEVKRTYPAGKDGDGGFQGSQIPVHAESVARLVEQRIDGKA
ncbi:hypothetical protein EXIGLDRAFT_772726 [Exidia glandulosa HHB12029]|uniref:Glycosyltransferase 61 catalytic domain-containing protein n=1 Tax=Exidia glandulosa HHB12029 TaxID=1314781 RepID=A0A165F649_EXIGL|nr:hypothetical protein EXIGLDRAFT_772726 [Exidia glandulosa HHB12029]